MNLLKIANGLVEHGFVTERVQVDGTINAKVNGEMVRNVGQERNTTVVKLNWNSKIGLMNLKGQ